MVRRPGVLVVAAPDDVQISQIEITLKNRWPDGLRIAVQSDASSCVGELSRWEDEGRAVALLVLLASRSARPLAVDLFTRRFAFRRSPPRTVWQSANGDLHEALFAKNRLGVERYVEADLAAPLFADLLVGLVAEFLHESALDIFHEVRGDEDLDVSRADSHGLQPAGTLPVRSVDGVTAEAGPPSLDARALEAGVLPFLLQASAAVIWIQRGKDRLRILLPENHAAFVRALGIVRETHGETSPRAGWAVFVGEAENAPREVHGTLEVLAQVAEARRALCFCSGITACFAEGYALERFADRDVFCPRRALVGSASAAREATT